MSSLEAWQIVGSQTFWALKWPLLCGLWFVLGELRSGDTPDGFVAAIFTAALFMTVAVANGWF